MRFSKSNFLLVAAICLVIAVMAGVLRWRESFVVMAGSEVRFSSLNDMIWDSATRRLTRTGSDPFGWIELQRSMLPLRRVTVEFRGKVDPVEGHFYFFQSVTQPVHVGLKMTEGKVTAQRGVVQVETMLDDSLCLRIDLPDFLVQPLELSRIVIENPFVDAARPAFLMTVGAGLGAIVALVLFVGQVSLRHRGVCDVFLLIFIVSALMRVGLTVVNRESGDDHMKVARMIMEQGRLPTTAEDWEGFQPKLYHTAVAVVGRLLLKQPSATGLVLTGQALSCLAGLVTLGLTYLFLKRLRVSDRTRLWCFAFTAFNPKLMSISVQSTNDSFVILFGSLAIATTVEYLRTESWRDWILLTAFLCLAALSKASGLVLVAILPGVVVLNLIWQIWRRSLANARGATNRLAKRLFVLGFAFAVLVPIPGQYFQRFQESGTPFATNIEVQPLPHWSDRTYVMRPGIISIRDGFLTFPLRSLLRSPMVLNHGAWGSDQMVFPGDDDLELVRPKAYPSCMVSFWAQIYGGVHFAHFDHWPPGWQSTDPLLYMLGRILLVAGLLPCLLWLAGLAPLFATELAPLERRDSGCRTEHCSWFAP